MAAKPSEIELIVNDFIDAVYNNGVLGYASVTAIENIKGRTYTDKECFAALRKMKAEGFIDTVNLSGYDWVESGLSLRSTTFTLSTEGRQKILKYHSYLNYLKSLKKEENSKAVERNIKNGNLIAAIIISVTTVILTQLPTRSSKQQKKLEEGIESIAKELDSLKQELHTLQIQPNRRQVTDTATSK